MIDAISSIDPNTHHNALNQGVSLNWYRIVSILGQGGFGITYLAFDTNLKQKVAIKEYLPQEFSVRGPAETVRPTSGDHKKVFDWGLKRFLEEAQTLAKFKHPNIVRVLSFFEANHTAYMVMEYEEGVDLASLIKAGEHFSEQRLLGILMPILDGLEKMHAAGFVHRDIKPSNIFIRGDGSPVLIDFGSARHAMRGHTRTMTSLVTPGYAPIEQYHDAEGKQGPWTDIYALGATCYCAITGKPPVDALKRGMVQFEHNTDVYLQLADIMSGKYSKQLLDAIDCALRFKDSERPQSIGEWQKILKGESEPVPRGGQKSEPRPTSSAKIQAAPDVDAKTVPYQPEPRQSQPRSRRALTGILLLLVLVTGGGYLYWSQPELARRADAVVDNLIAQLLDADAPPQPEPVSPPAEPPGLTVEMLLDVNSARLRELADKRAESELQAALVRLEQEKQALAKQVLLDADKTLRQSLAQKIAAVYRQTGLLQQTREQSALAGQLLQETDPDRRQELARKIVELEAGKGLAAPPAGASAEIGRSAAETEADLLVALTGKKTEQELAAEVTALEREKRILDERLQQNPDEGLRLQAEKKALRIELQSRRAELAREIRLTAEQALQEVDDSRLAGQVAQIAALQTQAAITRGLQQEPAITELARRTIAERRKAELARRQSEQYRSTELTRQQEQERLQAEIARLEAEKQRLAELARQEAEKTREAELAKQHAQELLREQLAKFETEMRRLAAQEQQEAERRRQLELEQKQALEIAQTELVDKIAAEQDFAGLTPQQAVRNLQAALDESADQAAQDIDLEILQKVVREHMARLQAEAEQRAEAERRARSETLLISGDALNNDGRLEAALRAFREVYDLNVSARDREIALDGIADTMGQLYARGNTENWQLFDGDGSDNLSGRYSGSYSTMETAGAASSSRSVPTLIAHRGSKITLAAIGAGIVVLADVDGGRGIVSYHDRERKINATGTIDTRPSDGIMRIEWQSDDRSSGEWRALDRSTLWHIDASGSYTARISNAHSSIFRKKTFAMTLTDHSRADNIGSPNEIVGISDDEYIELRGRKVGTNRIEFEFASKFSNYQGTGWFDIVDNRAGMLQGSWEVPGHPSDMSSGSWTLERPE